MHATARGTGGSASRSAHGGRGRSATHLAVAPGAGRDQAQYQATAPRQSRADHSRLGVHPTANPNLPRSRWRSGGHSGTRSAGESDGGQRPASFAYRRENRKKQKISSSVRRQHNKTSPATKPRPAGEARGTFYVATTFNQTIGAWNVASVKYMAPAVGRNRAHHFE
jgi:hypothetical protein